MTEQKNEGMLSLYRVLDLTDEKGLFCGKLLGDLGADVIKIEKPGGDPARNIGPFYHDEVDPEKSLFWFAHNTSKRGITLGIEEAEGQETFKKLVKGADIVIESFPPGYLDKLGLGYSALEKVNPALIMVSITPFGQTGPYRDYKAPDIVAWATGGKMYPYGDVDRAPIRISHHSQAYLHAGAQAAIGVMMALCYREMTGEGQQVDVSVQEAVAQTVYTAFWDTNKVIRRRGDDDYPNRLPAHMGQGDWKEPNREDGLCCGSVLSRVGRPPAADTIGAFRMKEAYKHNFKSLSTKSIPITCRAYIHGPRAFGIHYNLIFGISSSTN